MHSTFIRWWRTLGCGLFLGAVACVGSARAVDDVPPPSEEPATTLDQAPPLSEPDNRKSRPATDAPDDNAGATPSDAATSELDEPPTPDAVHAALDKPADKSSDDAKDASALGKADEDGPQELPPPPGHSRPSLAEGAKKPSSKSPPSEAAAFRGIIAGKSTFNEVTKAWGVPANRLKQKDIVRHTYRLEGFQQVEVRFYRDRVQSMLLQLKTFVPMAEMKELADELKLDTCAPVDISDAIGEALGAAYPECGVTTVFDPAHRDRRVAQVIIEPVDAQVFALRAEARLPVDYTGCQKDLDVALSIDPQMARGWWLRARVLRTIGQADAASKAVGEAVRLEPKNPEYQLTHAALLADAGHYDRAIQETRAVLPLCASRAALRAKAMNQLGDQLAAGPKQDFAQALQLHIQAIKLAEPRLEDRHVAVRKMARDVMVAAHLSAARDIAWGNWKKKDQIVPIWLKRAQELVEEDSSPGQTADNAMLVCRDALTASVGMEGALDPAPWVERALKVAQPELAACKDPLRQRSLEWELGCALYDALQVYHVLADKDKALKYGELAVEHLEAGAKDRELDTIESFLLGRLYFRMGSVYALHAQDPEKAVVWYERAIPLLERPIPPAAQADTGRHGETFVSMAVWYWAAGSRDEALRLTRQGLKLMQEGVKAGQLEESALKVPYTNLATMHRFLGDDEQADAFAEMASKAAETRRE